MLRHVESLPGKQFFVNGHPQGESVPGKRLVSLLMFRHGESLLWESLSVICRRRHGDSLS